jgi:peptide deformylase
MRAQDLEGKPIEEVATGFIPRVWQHETDHLNGTMLTDRMGPVARMANRRILNDLKEQYEALNPPPPPPPRKPSRPPARREKRRS